MTVGIGSGLAVLLRSSGSRDGPLGSNLSGVRSEAIICLSRGALGRWVHCKKGIDNLGGGWSRRETNIQGMYYLLMESFNGLP